MGLAASIIIGIVSFLIVSSSGNPLGGLIFGIVMFGMSYGAFVWRPSEKSTPPENSSTAAIAPVANVPFETKNLPARLPTAFQVGQILAGSLIEGADPDEIDHRELALLQNAGVSSEVYIQERFVLRAAIAAISIRAFISNEQIIGKVTAGFYDWFITNSQRSERAATTTALLKKRLPNYAAAAQKEMAKPDSDVSALSFNEVAFVFGDCLSEHNPANQDFGAACSSIAIALAPIYWQSQLDGAWQLFQRAGLVKQRESAA